MSIPKSQPRAQARSTKRWRILFPFTPRTWNVWRICRRSRCKSHPSRMRNSSIPARKLFHLCRKTPGLFLFDLLGEAFNRIVDTQKGAIELAVEQSHVLADLAQERGGSAAKVAEGVTTLFKQTVEQSVAAQKKTLDYYSQQHKTAYETAKRQFRISNPAAEAFQTGMDVLIETQKTMLDIACKPLYATAA